MAVLTEEDYPALKTELTTDPEGLGYAGKTDEECAVLLNTPGASNETLPNTEILISKVLDAIDTDELSAIAIGKLQFFLARMGDTLTTINLAADTDLVSQIGQIFTLSAAPNSRGNLLALTVRDASRAEILFGANTIVNYWDVARARALP